MKKLIRFLFILVVMTMYSCSDDIEDPKLAQEKIEKRQMTLLDWEPISPCESANLKLFIQPECIGTAWETAVLASIAEFNNSNSAVGFSVTTVESAADIVINCENLNNTGIGGNGQIPQDDNEVGSELNLNTQMLGFCGAGTEPCFLAHIVMHELGHTLGIAHNQDNLGDESGGMEVTWIEGTAPPGTNDPGSIFNDAVGCFTTCTFNANDILALQSIYPHDCSCYSPKILGPGNLCVNESGNYCVISGTNVIIQEVNWFGHPDINGSNNNCVSLSNSTEGIGFIYADVQIGECFYFISKKIEFGPPNILDNLEVKFDPCKYIIEINGLDPNPTTEYNWGDFTGLNNNPNVAISGPNNQKVSLKVLYGAGETLCFTVSATSDCGSSSLPCEICYTTPGCKGKGTPIVVNPNNTCNNGQCPDGYVCTEGICCEEDEPEPCDKPCESGFGCGAGYDCIDGCCVAVGGNPCFNDSKCPPLFTCINGICQPLF